MTDPERQAIAFAERHVRNATHANQIANLDTMVDYIDQTLEARDVDPMLQVEELMIERATIIRHKVDIMAAHALSQVAQVERVA